jgi:hypothetical protein
MNKIFIYFEQGKADLRTNELKKLDPVLAVLDNTGTNVTIAGHASAEGDLGFNERLSLRRAENVRNYLVKNGAKRLSFKGGLGAKYPQVRETGQGSALAALQAKNRRVEVDYVAGKAVEPFDLRDFEACKRELADAIKNLNVRTATACQRLQTQSKGADFKTAKDLTLKGVQRDTDATSDTLDRIINNHRPESAEGQQEFLKRLPKEFEKRLSFDLGNQLKLTIMPMFNPGKGVEFKLSF